MPTAAVPQMPAAVVTPTRCENYILFEIVEADIVPCGV
jgi:hypothetical protein